MRCGNTLDKSSDGATRRIVSGKPENNLLIMIVKRGIICLAVCFLTVLIFYLSLIFTAGPLSVGEKQQIKQAISVLEAKGFKRETFILNNFTVMRANDNWLNASSLKETAYAATNFPFEVVTIYPAYFTVPQDDTERAMVLLHEAQHLQGKDEKEAYEYVWKNRKMLGWTKDKYGDSIVWRNVRKQTKEYAPNLFICDFNEYGDCTE